MTLPGQLFLYLENDLVCEQFSLYNTIANISWHLRELELKSHYLSGESEESLWNINGAYKEALQ